MKYNLYNRIFYSYLKGRNKIIITLIVSSLINFLGVLLFVMMFYGIEGYLSKAKDQLEIKIILRNNITQTELNSLLENIHRQKFVSSVDYISPEKGVGIFSRKYHPDFKKLMIDGLFPGISNVKIDFDKSDNQIFKRFIMELKSEKNINEVVYNNEYFMKLHQVDDALKKIEIIAIALIGTILFIFNFRGFELMFGNLKSDISTYYQTGVPFKFWFYPMLLIIIFVAFSVMLLSGGILLIFANYVPLNMYSLIHFDFNIILISFLSALVFILFTSVISIVYLNLKQYARN